MANSIEILELLMTEDRKRAIEWLEEMGFVLAEKEQADHAKNCGLFHVLDRILRRDTSDPGKKTRLRNSRAA